jgi:hypothetical protein
MANFLQLTPENIAQAKGMSWGQALKTEIPGSSTYRGFNPTYKGAGATGLGGYIKSGLRSLTGNVPASGGVGGATPLTRKLALSAMDYVPKALGIASKFLGPAGFLFGSTAMGNAELPEDLDYEQEYFDYYNKYGDDYSNLKIPGSNWRQKLMNHKIQQQKKKIGMPEHLTYTPPSPQIQQVQQNIQTYGNRDRPNTGINTPGGGKGQSPTGGDVAGTPFVRGGRAGYFDGGLASLWPR